MSDCCWDFFAVDDFALDLAGALFSSTGIVVFLPGCGTAFLYTVDGCCRHISGHGRKANCSSLTDQQCWLLQTAAAEPFWVAPSLLLAGV
jgi:hypothetical protein